MLRKISKQKIFLVLVDLIIITISLYVSHFIRFGRWLNIFDEKRLLTFIFLSGMFILSFYVFDLYNNQKKVISSEFMIMFIVSLISIALLMSFSFYLAPFIVGRGIFFFFFITISILTFLWRLSFQSFFNNIIPTRKLLFVGKIRNSRVTSSILKQVSEYDIVGYINDPASSSEEGSSVKCLGHISEIGKIIDLYKINEIVIVRESIIPKISELLVNIRLKGIKIHTLPAFYEYVTQRLPVMILNDKWVIYSQGFDKLGESIYKKIKQGIDFTLALVMLIFTLPISLVVAIMIKITSKGPILYLQERVGLNEKTFLMYKFRTMVINAEKDNPKWARENDKRITPFGKILRKTRLDELPQLINILKGEMSLIGPRPEREYFVRKLKQKVPYYSLRFAVNPGLTGWAQVNYKYGSSIKDAINKLSYDLYYIKNMSIFLDLRIILKTIRICLFGMGR